PGAGVRRLSSIVFGPPGPAPDPRVAPTLGFGPGGAILASNGILAPIGDAAAWTLALGSPVSTSREAVAGLTSLGAVVVLMRDVAAAWSGKRVALPSPVLGTIALDVLLYTDPRDGQRYLFVTTADGLWWGRVDGSAEPSLTLLSNSVATPIVADASLFTTADNRVVIAGADPAGDLVVFYQSGQFDPIQPANWLYDNLTVNQLERSGQTFTPIAGTTASFAASWGAMHI